MTIGLCLQIQFINKKVIKKGSDSFIRELLLVASFFLAPILWSRYEIMRRDIELFIINRKTE